ncbi:LGFP repeat-containing protein [Arenivirga flava]|uniref:LGFP repeat-containing protein n=1 Tax=Arenivirga flava TaxID=1930060 RepID=UPI003D66DE7B
MRRGRCSTSYSGGLLGWTAASGVHSITGERFRSYSAYGGEDGALGVPVGATIPSSASGGGSTQRFQGGYAYSSAGSTYFANGDSLIHARYQQLGGPGSRLGWPTSNEVCANGTCTSRYQGGTLTWTAAGGVRG